jgi:hypothetical protein
MPNSKAIAGLLGPTLAALGLTILLNSGLLPGIAAGLAQDPLIVMLAGFAVFVAGLAIVRGHNQWRGGWPVVVTVLGWLFVAGGLVRILFPVQLAQFAARVIQIPALPPITAGVFLALGGFLSFKAYSRS